MSKSPDSRLRDPTRPAEHYRGVIAVLEQRIESALKTGSPNLFRPIADYHLRICRAMYSAGDDVASCGEHLREATEYRRRSFAEATRPRLLGLEPPEEYLEAFSGAFLIGGAEDLISAFTAVLPEQIASWERGIVDPLCAVLLLKSPTLAPQEMEAVMKIKPYALLPDLFRAVAGRDLSAFREALEAYLVKGWGPPAERMTKGDLRSEYPVYAGKWCFFAAAVCRIVGVVPELSKKALQYCPVELARSPA